MKVAMLIAPDFKDETLSMLQLMFGKNDIEGVVVGFSLKECKGYHGAVVMPKTEAKELDPNSYDVLILVDGPGVDSFKLYDNRPLLDLVRTFHDSKKIVVGIGNSMKVIARANVIRDTKMARPESTESEKMTRLYRGVVTEDDLVFDKGVLTATDSGRIDKLVELLASNPS
jgi:putative intracellular protease/amidase